MKLLLEYLPWLAAGYYAGTCLRCVACWIANGPRYIVSGLIFALLAFGLSLYGWTMGAVIAGWICLIAGFFVMMDRLKKAGWYGDLDADLD